jgi:hypothetical protein
MLLTGSRYALSKSWWNLFVIVTIIVRHARHCAAFAFKFNTNSGLMHRSNEKKKWGSENHVERTSGRASKTKNEGTRCKFMFWS